MTSIVKFGTKGFLCALMSAQLSFVAHGKTQTVEKNDRALIDAKKSPAATRREVIKPGRKVTGSEARIQDLEEDRREVMESKKEVEPPKQQAE